MKILQASQEAEKGMISTDRKYNKDVQAEGEILEAGRKNVNRMTAETQVTNEKENLAVKESVIQPRINN